MCIILAISIFLVLTSVIIYAIYFSHNLYIIPVYIIWTILYMILYVKLYSTPPQKETNSEENSEYSDEFSYSEESLEQELPGVNKLIFVEV